MYGFSQPEVVNVVNVLNEQRPYNGQGAGDRREKEKTFSKMPNWMCEIKLLGGMEDRIEMTGKV